MKILIIFTGGTIGSSVKNGSISADESTKYALIEKYESVHGKADFDTASPYCVLSENLSANELNLLQAEIIRNLDKGYDGIIVTHGTDSLHYSSVAVEYAINGCKIPVVFVSSDYPLEDPRANGHKNFEAAVEFIKSRPDGGVYVSYKNRNEQAVNIHIPSSMLQHSECSADIFSIVGMPYAYYDGKVTLNNINCKPEKALGQINFADESGVLVIDSRPADSFTYSLDGIKAVILKPYHSATLNTASEKLKAFCERAKNAGIPVFVVNVKSGISYESTSLFSELGIIPLPYSTYISAYMKIWAAVSLDIDVKDFTKE